MGHPAFLASSRPLPGISTQLRHLRGNGQFLRCFSASGSVDSEKVRADYKAGGSSLTRTFPFCQNRNVEEAD